MWRVIWTQWIYRLACASGRGTDEGARPVLAAVTAWAEAGAPGRRIVWAAAWLMHWALCPVRWWHGGGN